MWFLSQFWSLIKRKKNKNLSEQARIARGVPILESVYVGPTTPSGFPVSSPIPPQPTQPSSDPSQPRSQPSKSEPIEEVVPKLNKITVCFKQYKDFSPWFKVTMVVGTDEAVRCMGGYVGGIKRVTLEEQKRWLTYFPEYQIL